MVWVGVGVAVVVFVAIGVGVEVGARIDAEVGSKRLKRIDKHPAASRITSIVRSMDPRVLKMS